MSAWCVLQLAQLAYLFDWCVLMMSVVLSIFLADMQSLMYS